jgi:uncharacterized protein (TIRG00374 family)
MSRHRSMHIVSALVITVFAGILLIKLDFHRTYEAVTGVKWRWGILVAVLNLLSVGIESLRWHFILSVVKRHVAFGNTFAAYLVGLTGNFVVPFKLGDGARAYALSKTEGIAMTTSLSSVVLDRIVDISFFCALVIPSALLYRAPLKFKVSGLVVGAAIALLIVVLVVVLAIKDRSFGGKTFARLNEIIRRFIRMVYALRRTRRFVRVGSLSVILWMNRLAMIYAMFEAFSIELPAASGLAVLVLINLGITIVSTPASVGAFELSAASGLLLFGVDANLALSYAITLHVVEVVPVAVLGFVVLWITGIRLREVPERIAFTQALEMADAESFSREIDT